MRLEIIIGQTIGGLVAGFRHGITHDNKILYGVEMKLLDVEAETAKKVMSETKNILRKTEYHESIIAGGITGAVSLGMTLDATYFSTGILIGASSYYCGLQAGKLYSNIKRSKAEFTTDEESIVDNYLTNIQACYRTDDIQYEKLTDKLLEYVRDLDKQKASPKIHKQLLEKVMQSLKPIQEYRRFKNFFRAADDNISVMPMYKDKDQIVDAIIIHDNRLYRIGMGDIKVPKGEEDIDDMRKSMEELSWDGTVDKAFTHIQELNNIRNLMIVSGPNELPIEVKLMAAQMSYKIKK